MSNGVLEEILDTLKRIEVGLAGAAPAAPAAAPAAAAEPPKRGRKPAAPAVQPAATVGDDSFLNDDPKPVVEVTKDEVREALKGAFARLKERLTPIGQDPQAATQAILKTAGGVDNLSALPKEKFAAVKAAADAAK